MEAVVDDAGGAILAQIARLDAVRAQTEARIAERMLAFAGLRGGEAARAATPTVADLEASFIPDELSTVLLQSTVTVQCRLAEARRVRDRLPQAWHAWTAGRIDQARVRLIAAAVDKLDEPGAVHELDGRVVGYAATHTTGQLRAWLGRFVARHVSGTDRHDKARDHRGVYVTHDDDGMSWLHAFLATSDAARIDALLTALAKRHPVEGSTLEQRRADLFADLLLGRGQVSGSAAGGGGNGALIGVTIPVTSLAGLDDTPGESIDRRFSLPAGLVRALAAEPGTLFYRLLTDPLGHLLDVTETGRFPSRRLRTALHFRDGVCAFPTCNVPAPDCDADHTIPAPRGPTSAANLKNLCRRHHRFKTYGVLDTLFDTDGHRWRLPDQTLLWTEDQPLPPPPPPPSRLEADLMSFLTDTGWMP